MRKLFAVVLAVLLLAGCAARETQPQPSAANTVGLCLRGDLASAGYQAALNPILQENGWSVTVVDAGQDQSLQDQQIHDFIKSGISLLIIEPVLINAVSELVDTLRQADTPAVFIGRQPAEEALAGWDRVCYAGSCEDPSVTQAQLVLSTHSGGDLNGDGIVSYGVLAGAETEQFTADALQTYAALFPNGILLEVSYTTLTKEDGKQHCHQMISRFGPDLEVLFCHSDALALGAAEALQADGRTVGTDLFVIGNGGSREALEWVQTERLTGTVLLSNATLAQTVSAAAATLLSDQAVAPLYPVPWTPVDRKTAVALLK